jgi:arylsulfatase A-like enzyme/cytochrome c-type biogenesis protein CcmH/NrfG
MKKTPNNKKPIPWRRYGLLAVVLLLIIRTVWRWPRRTWSLEESPQTSAKSEEAYQPDLPTKEIRNVVLISIDTCRADHLNCYGYSRKTSPNIDAVAEDGIIFNHAVTPVPITLPAHSSMLTGMIPPYHKVRDNSHYRLSDSNITLAEILREKGFATGAFVSSFVMDSQFGLDQGFDTFNDDLPEKEQQGFQFGLINERKAEEVTSLANIWLEEHRNDKFFLFLHYFDPHYPYVSHKRFLSPSLPLLALTRDRYDSEIAYTDYHIGRVINKLKQLNLYESTLLIITSDHGEGLGQHSENSHAFFIYHSTVHVPLIIKIPGGPKGIRINDIAGLIDIVPTVCGSLGIAVPPDVQGKNLNSFLERETTPVEQRYLYCESLMPTKFGFGPFLGLVSGHWKYFHISEPELFDLRQTPIESKNLLNQQTHQARIMQDQLRLILQGDSLRNIAGSKLEMDEKTINRLQSLGYIAGGAVDENIQFDRNRLDLKEFMKVYNFSSTFYRLALLKKYDKAKKLCNDMLKEQPEMKEPHYYLGLIALYTKDTKDAIRHISKYLENTDSEAEESDIQIKNVYDMANAHLKLAAALAIEGQYEQAIPNYNKALSYNPDMLKANYDLACIYLEQGKISDAVTYYTKVLELNPDFYKAHFYLGDALLRLGKIEKAITHYNKAIVLKPDWQDAHRKLQEARYRQQQINQKTDASNKSTQENPNQ